MPGGRTGQRCRQEVSRKRLGPAKHCKSRKLTHLRERFQIRVILLNVYVRRAFVKLKMASGQNSKAALREQPVEAICPIPSKFLRFSGSVPLEFNYFSWTWTGR